jgi:hypothetical protein
VQHAHESGALRVDGDGLPGLVVDVDVEPAKPGLVVDPPNLVGRPAVRLTARRQEGHGPLEDVGLGLGVDDEMYPALLRRSELAAEFRLLHGSDVSRHRPADDVLRPLGAFALDGFDLPHDEDLLVSRGFGRVGDVGREAVADELRQVGGDFLALPSVDYGRLHVCCLDGGQRAVGLLAVPPEADVVLVLPTAPVRHHIHELRVAASAVQRPG